MPTWDYVTPLAWISLNLTDGDFPDLQTLARARLKTTADRLVGTQNSYGTTMGACPERFIEGASEKDFAWGSNGNAAFHSVVLLNACRASGDKAYLDAALSNIDYLLGRNPLGKSYVTGFGANPPQHIHHRPSEADGIAAPVPGFLVGGPHPASRTPMSAGTATRAIFLLVRIWTTCAATPPTRWRSTGMRRWCMLSCY